MHFALLLVKGKMETIFEKKIHINACHSDTIAYVTVFAWVLWGFSIIYKTLRQYAFKLL